VTDDELRQLVASNSRSIQALTDNIAELTNDVRLLTQENREAQAERTELRQATGQFFGRRSPHHSQETQLDGYSVKG
jgi:C4-dicarboxylate-specific signal transduction histidine kinase